MEPTPLDNNLLQGKGPSRRETNQESPNEVLYCQRRWLRKRKPYTIHNYENPQCFKPKIGNYRNLPVHYYWNRKAWMQVSIWYDFLRDFENDMRLQGRKVILLSDNAPTHADPTNPPEN